MNMYSYDKSKSQVSPAVPPPSYGQVYNPTAPLHQGTFPTEMMTQPFQQQPPANYNPPIVQQTDFSYIPRQQPEPPGVVPQKQQQQGRCCYATMAFFMAVALISMIASMGLLIYFSENMVKEWKEENNWIYALNPQVIKVNYTGIWIDCSCDPHGGYFCISRYPCLEVTIRPGGDGWESPSDKTLYLNLRHKANAGHSPRSQCFFNPKDSCFESESVNKAITDAYMEKYAPDKWQPVSYYYYNKYNENQAVLHADYWMRSDMIKRVVPPSITFVLSALFFIGSIVYFCKK